eukprot:49789-Prorocentrum_minimum.AAC.4
MGLLDEELREKGKTIEKYEVEIRRRNDEIEKKTKDVDRYNRQYEKLTGERPPTRCYLATPKGTAGKRIEIESKRNAEFDACEPAKRVVIVNKRNETETRTEDVDRYNRRYEKGGPASAREARRNRYPTTRAFDKCQPLEKRVVMVDVVTNDTRSRRWGICLLARRRWPARREYARSPDAVGDTVGVDLNVP